MADSEKQGATAQGQDQGQDESRAQAQDNRPGYEISLQYLKDLSFENPKAPGIFSQRPTEPKNQLRMNTDFASIGQGLYEVQLSLSIRLVDQEEPVYVVDLVYAGIVRVRNFPENSIEPFLMIEIPRLLFPEVRALVRRAVVEGGFPPPQLPMLDFQQNYRRKLEAKKNGGAVNSGTDNLKMDVPPANG